MVLVNLFHTKPEYLLIARHGKQYIGIADNGLLSMILEGVPEQVVAIPLDRPKTEIPCITPLFWPRRLPTFYAGSLEKIGDPSISIQVKNPLKPMLGNN